MTSFVANPPTRRALAAPGLAVAGNNNNRANNNANRWRAIA